MKTYTKPELNKILVEHKAWLKDPNKGKRADLSNSNLSNSDLSRANPSYSDLSRANLSNSDLSNSNLSYSDLSRANLSNSNLSNSDLSNSNLSNSDLSNSNLSNAITSHNKYLISTCLGNYQMVAFMQYGRLLITAGCRRGWTVEEAREHWLPENMNSWTEKTAKYGERQLRMVEFLISEAKHLGWIK